MFEIGSSLRAARERQGLELSKVEQATHIRSRYLAALEEERFDVIPGAAYTKGFLRTYADYLGLDGQRFIDEYSARFPPAEEPPGVSLARVRRRHSLLQSQLLVVLAFAVLLGLIGWRLATVESRHNAAPSLAPRTVSHARLSHPTPPFTRPPARRRTTARIVLTARDRCWISVRLDSAVGRRLYERTLERGDSVRFVARRLWIRIGAPWNLAARLNGKPVQLPTSIASVIVTPAGLRTRRVR
jgi:transcriptional regulator with XRE-family HTH domain